MYLPLLEFTPREAVEHSHGSRGPVEVRDRKSVRLRLQLELLHAQEQPSVLVLQLLVPELILLHPRELVLQQLYVLHRGLEDRALVRPDVPDDLVVSATRRRANEINTLASRDTTDVMIIGVEILSATFVARLPSTFFDGRLSRAYAEKYIHTTCKHEYHLFQSI